MKIILFGANGQIGSAVFAKLRKHLPEAEILACVRAPHLHFEGVAGNHWQRSVVFDLFRDDWNALEKADVVINCIGVIDEQEISFEQAHVLPLLLLTDHFEQLGQPKVIQLSALGASFSSPAVFQRTKAMAEKLALRLPEAVVVRPSIVCSPGTMLVQKLKRLQRLTRFTGGRIPVPQQMPATKIQPVCIGDLAALMTKLVTEKTTKRSIDVVGPDIFSLAELLAIAGLRPVPINASAADRWWKLLRPFFRRVMNNEQFQLLKTDNCSQDPAAEELLGRSLLSTHDFWKRELTQ